MSRWSEGVYICLDGVRVCLDTEASCDGRPVQMEVS